MYYTENKRCFSSMRRQFIPGPLFPPPTRKRKREPGDEAIRWRGPAPLSQWYQQPPSKVAQVTFGEWKMIQKTKDDPEDIFDVVECRLGIQVCHVIPSFDVLANATWILAVLILSPHLTIHLSASR